jgi:hypothetical protein
VQLVMMDLSLLFRLRIELLPFNVLRFYYLLYTLLSLRLVLV